jgi:hypothetical protein
MSILHTPIPELTKGHIGEHNLAKDLVALEGLDAEFWFGVNFLPNVRDLDLILFHKKAGLYLIEVKAVDINSISQFDLKNFVLLPNTKRTHPQEQIRIAQIQLKTYILSWAKIAKKPMIVPFMQTSIIWPLISRSDWNVRFTDPQIRKLSEAMLFKDDIRTSRNLVDALQRLWTKPLGTVPPKDCRGEHPGMDNLRMSIQTSEYKPEFTEVEKAEFSRPASQSKDYAAKYPAGPKYNVSFEGAPGTGKTTVLREIALAHSASGGAVLHICFNKTLAADQIREYQFLNKSDYGFIDVRDEWAFYKSIDPSINIEHKNQLQDLLQKALNQYEQRDRVYYDTIIIDEAQDCSENIFQALQLVSRPNASWFIGYGAGQEINNITSDGSATAPWLHEWFKTAERNTLRRSFRNSTRAFLMSQAFWEKYPDLDNAKKWILEKIKNQKTGNNELELDLGLLKIKNDFKITTLGTDYRKSIKNLLLENLEDARSSERGGDLLLAVAYPRSNPKDNEYSSYNDVLAVANELVQEIGIQVFDLYPEDNRRKVTTLESIRIANYQIIRGLSASHVILFDLDTLEHWCDDNQSYSRPPFRNYGNIALSRSKVSTVIAVRPEVKSSTVDFLQNLLNYIRFIPPTDSIQN